MTEQEELADLWGGTGTVDWAVALKDTWAELDEICPPDAQKDRSGKPGTFQGAGTSVRDRERLAQGAGAILSLSRAAELLPGSDADNIRWLRDQGLARTLHGKEVVVWQEVLNKLAVEEKTPTAPQPAKTRRSKEQSLPRIHLGRR